MDSPRNQSWLARLAGLAGLGATPVLSPLDSIVPTTTVVRNEHSTQANHGLHPSTSNANH